MSAQPLSYAGAEVHRFDRARFLTALFAPPEKREALLVLYAFNVQIARIQASVRDPMAGMIRLQWWRDVLDGQRPDEIANHPVAAPLLGLGVPVSPLHRALDAREHDFSGQPFADLAVMEHYARATSGTLAEVALAVLGVGDDETLAAAGEVGTALALTGMRHQAITEIGERAGTLLAAARRRRVDPRGNAVLLQGTVAGAYLRQARPILLPLWLAFNALRGRF